MTAAVRNWGSDLLEGRKGEWTFISSGRGRASPVGVLSFDTRKKRTGLGRSLHDGGIPSHKREGGRSFILARGRFLLAGGVQLLLRGKERKKEF